MEVINVLFTIVFVLFLPGFTISLVFFDWNKIDLIERIALSFALSISIVPLVVFYLNLLGVPVNKVSVAFQILLILTIATMVLIFKHFTKK
jgi:uncharacterized membrane protein